MSDSTSGLRVIVGVDGVSAAQAQITRFGSEIGRSFDRVGQSAASMNALSARLKQVGDEASKTGEHVAGMAYYFRSGIDSIRFAAMDGGARAGFYAIDEGVRALLASGMQLGTLVPVLGVLGAAVGTAYLAWEQWNKGIAETQQHVKDLTDSFEQLPKLIQQISDMQKVGLLGPTQSKEYLDYVTGNKPLYKDRLTGQISKNPMASYDQQEAGSLPFSVLSQGTPFRGGIRVPNQQLDPTKDHDAIAKWTQDNITAGGEVTQQMTEALKALGELSQKMEDERLTGIAKEKQAITERYAAERAEMQNNLEVATEHLSSVSFASNPNVLRAQIDLAQSASDEKTELDAKDADYNQQQLDRLTKVYDSYQKIFNTVSDDISKTSAAQFAADRRHEQELDRQLKQQEQLRQEISRGQTEGQLKGISDNPFLTTQQKTEQSIPLYQQQLQFNAGRIGDLLNTAATTSDVSAQLEAQLQIVQLTQEQVELQAKLSAAEGANSWTYQLKAAATHFQDINTLAQQTSQLLEGTLNTAINSVASNFTKVLDGTETWRKALLNIGETIVNSVVEGIIKMGEEWVVQELLKLAVSETVNTTSATTAAVTASILARAWEPAAVYSAIATEGVSLAAGVSAIAMGAFDVGGFTGHGNPADVAGVVHKGEYVFSAPAVDRIGVPTLEAMHNGGSGSPAMAGAGNSQQSMTHKVVVVMDRQGLLNEYKKQDFGQITVAHVFNNRMKAGIST